MADTQQTPTGKMMDATDNKGADVVIYSTGAPAGEADFAKAMDAYNKSGGTTTPQGYLVLKPGRTNDIRQMFETGNKYLQQGAQSIAKSGDLIPPEDPQLGASAGVSGFNAILNAAKSTAPLLADQVSTPAKLGMTLGMAGVAPLLKGASLATEAGGVGFSKATMLLNMLKTGVAGAGGAALGRASTGEGLDVGKTATEFALASAGGGFQSVLGHWITKYISPDKQEGVAKEILDSIVSRYPNMANDPDILRSYASSPDNLKRITQQMSGALRGRLDDVTSNITSDIKQALLNTPRSLTSGQQNSINSDVRKLAQLGNDFLDNINNPKEALLIQGAMSKAQNELVDKIHSFYPNMSNFGPTEAKLITAMMKQKNDLNQFKEGAEVLGWLQHSGAASGYNHEAFSNSINSVYQQNPGSLLEHVGDILGQGGPLVGQGPAQAAQESAAAPTLGGEILRTLKGWTPYLKHIPMSDRNQPTLLSWRTPQTPSTAFSIGAQQSVTSGADAIQSFVDRNKR